MAIYYECDFCPENEVKQVRHEQNSSFLVIKSGSRNDAVICENCAMACVELISERKADALLAEEIKRHGVSSELNTNTLASSETANDWIEWSGGECPVDPDTVVEVEYKDGERWKELAISINWQHGSDYAIDIIRYRVVV